MRNCLHKDHGRKNSSQAHAHESGASRVRGHVDIADTTGSRLLLTLAFNFIIPVAQVIGGSYANSMALISDATHNFSDFTAILIAYFAYRIGQQGASARNTFGYRRAEILAALINAMILLGAAIFIVYESLGRFRHPGVVSGQIVMWMAGIGVLGNGLSAWLLHRDAKHSLNVRGAFVHMLGDLLTSVVVLVNGAILIFKPWYWLDPLLSILIVLFILKNSWSILKEAGMILMNATPRGLDIAVIKDSLEQIPGVCGIHHIHTWDVSSSSRAFSCHVVVADQFLSETETLAGAIRHNLFHRFGIDDPVLQFETPQSGNGSLLCEISSRGTERT